MHNEKYIKVFANNKIFLTNSIMLIFILITEITFSEYLKQSSINSTNGYKSQHVSGFMV